MPAANFCSSSSSHLSSPYSSTPSWPDTDTTPNSSVLNNMSPKLSSTTNSNSKPEKVLYCDTSLKGDSENTVSSIVSIPTHHSSTPKSCDELRKEIATLEAEIVHLERYLLSLYRTAFEDHLQPSSGFPQKLLGYNTESPSQVLVEQQPDYKLQDEKNGDSGRRSLADHLGAASFFNHVIASDRLSEDIVRCISSIYCRISNPLEGHAVLSGSPASSLSSSSIFSSQNPCDKSSPHCNDDTTVDQFQFQELREESGQDNEMVEVLKICLDDTSFNYAEAMLKNFRLLVRSLEKVDPMKMKREEKLAFWINIHNALVMHAAYNVGGHCINAYTIQNILGIRPHYSEPLLQTLISPGRKYKTASMRHTYALEYPEPLVHFALCSGTRSDPPVRVYTSKNIFQELKHAKEEFVRSSVSIHKETKIFLPKILSYFAKDMSIDMAGLLEIVIGCLQEEQQQSMRKCMRRKFDRFTLYYLLVAKEKYAGLYFCMCVDEEDNELEILDIIHHYVEILDRYFGSVCELDLIFNFHKAYYILDEIMIAGEFQESSKRSVIRLMSAHDSLVEMAKEQATSISNVIAQVTK
ncbi:hypothetical protein Tsubulata_046166 [Turnera subulata]|uniref:DUF547 domain-containing protein n=1 Tax=Turnera subulata TaxID=218843 RepID=A0A9Q0G932_9ROSI|nr:hypothetical protein Tsubulata_046166 [Turnera subulata]